MLMAVSSRLYIPTGLLGSIRGPYWDAYAANRFWLWCCIAPPKNAVNGFMCESGNGELVGVVGLLDELACNGLLDGLLGRDDDGLCVR